MNSDGFDDILVGARGDQDRGIAYLILGPVSGVMSLATADAKWQGQAESDEARRVSGAGDIDGDNFADFVVGAANAAGERGAAYLLYGGQ